MTKLSEARPPHFGLTESAAPSTPATGEFEIYAATDGTLHTLNDAAVDTELGALPSLGAGKVTRENVTNVTIASTTFADIDSTNITLTFTTGARRVLLGFMGRITHSASGALTSFNFTVDGTPVETESTASRGLITRRSEGVGVSGGVSVVYLTDALTAASHTFRPRWNTSTGTATLQTSGAAQYAVFWAQEVL